MIYEWDNAMDAAEHTCGDRNKNSFVLTIVKVITVKDIVSK